MNNTIPILRVELQHASHAIMIAIEDELLKLDKDIHEAVQAICTPEYVQKVVQQAVKTQLDAAITREVKNYFYYSGEGHAIIKKAVAKRLKEQEFEI